MTDLSFVNIVPEAILILVASATYVGATFTNKHRTWSYINLAALFGAMVFLSMASNTTTGSIRSDSLAQQSKLCLLIAGILFTGMSWSEKLVSRSGEFHASLLLIIAGSMLTATANNLILIFLGLELISIPSYLLLYLVRNDTQGQEAATKYFFLSILSSAILLYGLSFHYGIAGSTNLETLATVFHHSPQPTALSLIAMVLILSGLAFKLAAFPFHFYAPDVYQGTAPLTAGLLAFIPKAAGVIALLRLFSYGVVGIEARTSSIVLLLGIVSMTVGNILALRQDHLRRIFAYSSIAHAGYMMLAIAVSFHNTPGSLFAGNQTLLFYLVSYALATIGTFGVLSYFSRQGNTIDHIDQLAGLVHTHPTAAHCMAIFLFSLMGIPPFMGFWAKFSVLSGTLTHAFYWDNPLFFYATVIGGINAAIAAFYNLRIIITIYLRQSLGRLQPEGGTPALASITVCALLTLIIGIVPNTMIQRTGDTARARQSILEPKRDSIPSPEHSKQQNH